MLGHAQDRDHWRDVMFQVSGPLARRLQAAFADARASSSGEILVGPGVYPPIAEGTSGAGRFLHKVWSPSDDDYSMAHFFLFPLLAARESAYIVTPYFIPDRHLKRTLEERARAGVDVRLLMPGTHMENRTARWSAQTHYDDLIQAGVRVYEYAPTYLHSKFIVVDRQWSIIGSPNLNSRSGGWTKRTRLAFSIGTSVAASRTFSSPTSSAPTRSISISGGAEDRC